MRLSITKILEREREREGERERNLWFEIITDGNDEGVVVEEGDRQRAMAMEILGVQMEKQRLSA